MRGSRAGSASGERDSSRARRVCMRGFWVGGVDLPRSVLTLFYEGREFVGLIENC